MENTSPHSAVARAQLVRKTRAGKEIKPPAPSPREVEILRRIARGSLLVTMVEGNPQFCYEDGAIPEISWKKSFGSRELNKFVRNGWIVAVKGESLLEGEAEAPQRYVVPPLR